MQITVLDVDPDPRRAATARQLEAERAPDVSHSPRRQNPVARAHLLREPRHAAGLPGPPPNRSRGLTRTLAGRYTGDHGGFVTLPEQCAQVLDQVLTQPA